jgi:transcriptional regulator CBF1
LDHDGHRPAPHDNNGRNHDTMNEQGFSSDDQDVANALAQHNDSAAAFGNYLNQNGNSAAVSAADTASAALHVQMNVPQPTELSFQTQTSGSENERPLSSSFGMGDHGQQTTPHGIPSFDADYMKTAHPGSGGESSPTSKPQVGSEEWHKVRRDNHKEGKLKDS